MPIRHPGKYLSGDYNINVMFAEDVTFLVIKYLLEGIAVSVASYYLSSKKASVQETLVIGVTAATCFLLLDLFAPAVGSSTRNGAGLGIGLQRVGFEPFDTPETIRAKKEWKKKHPGVPVMPIVATSKPVVPIVQGFQDGSEPEEEGYSNYRGFAY